MERESIQLADPKLARIQGLLARYLSARASESTPDTGHLDDDSLAAFVGGGLSERESRPVINHLVDCSFCRHITAELVRLDVAFTESDATPSENKAASNAPTRVSDVLNGIMAKIFGPGDAAVFAHGEDDDDQDEDAKTAETESKKQKD